MNLKVYATKILDKSRKMHLVIWGQGSIDDTQQAMTCSEITMNCLDKSSFAKFVSLLSLIFNACASLSFIGSFRTAFQ